MGTPLKNPPVYFTICQVRFNQLLKLAEFLPVIQEAFSKAGYPAYETQSNLVIQMVAQEGKPEQLQPLPTTHNSYQFGSLEFFIKHKGKRGRFVIDICFAGEWICSQ